MNDVCQDVYKFVNVDILDFICHYCNNILVHISMKKQIQPFLAWRSSIVVKLFSIFLHFLPQFEILKVCPGLELGLESPASSQRAKLFQSRCWVKFNNMRLSKVKSGSNMYAWEEKGQKWPVDFVRRFRRLKSHLGNNHVLCPATVASLNMFGKTFLKVDCMNACCNCD